MYSMVAIYPNSSDDWSSTSPFTGYNLSGGKTGFILGTITDSSLSSFVAVLGKLLDIGKRNQKVDIFSSSFSQESKFKGVGNTSSVSDFTFTVEATTGDINHAELFGRTVKIATGTGTSLNDIGHGTVTVLGTGQIYGVDPSKNTIVFSVRGHYSMWMDKEIGTLTEGDNESDKSKIIPISYGDFSDEHGFIPIVLDAEMYSIPTLYLDEQELKSLDGIYCWDKEASIAYTAKQGSEVTIAGSNNSITLVEDNSNYICSATGSWDSSIDIWNPPRISFELSSAPSPSLVAHTSWALTANPADGGTIYEDADGNRYEFLESNDPYYVFTTANNTPTAASGTLTKVYAGQTGPATLTYTWHSSVLNPYLDLEQTDETSANLDSLYNASPSACLFKVGNEIMQIAKEGITELSNLYYWSDCEVLRALQGTSRQSHSIDDVIYTLTPATAQSSWLVRHKFEVEALSNFSWLIGSGDYDTEPTIVSLFNRPYLLDLVVDIPATKEGLLSLDLKFPKISISGNVQNAYFIGEVYCDAGANGASTVNTSIALGKGGRVIPLPTKQSISYGGVSLGCLNGVGCVHKPTSVERSLFSLPADSWNAVRFICTQNVDTYGGTVNVPALSSPWGSGSVAGLNNIDSTDRDELERYRLLNEIVNTSDSDYTSGLENYVNGHIFNIQELNSSRFSLMWHLNCGSTGGSGRIRIARAGLYVHFYVDPTKTQFWARGQGRVYIDGTTYYNGSHDDLIENPVSVIEDLARTELGLTDSELDETSFDAAYTAREAWKAAFIIYGEPKTFREITTHICKQFNLVIGETPDGKLTVSSLDVPESNGGLTSITDAHIARDSNDMIRFKEEYTTLKNVITALKLRYQLREPDGAYQAIFDTDGSGWDDLLETAEDTLDDTRQVVFDLDTVREAVTPTLIAGTTIQYVYKPLRVLKWFTDTEYNTIKVGDWVTCGSSVIPGVSNKVYLIVETDIQVPINNKAPECCLTGIEFSIGGDDDAIQEVPNAGGGDNAWQEEEPSVCSGDDEIQEQADV